MKIGDTVYWFDQNKRVYIKGQSAPVWREHWRAMKIVGETPRSWVTDWYGTKLPKKGPLPRGWCASQEEIDEQEYIEIHKYKIAEAVRRIEDPELLRAVAAVVGYAP